MTVGRQVLCDVMLYCVPVPGGMSTLRWYSMEMKLLGTWVAIILTLNSNTLYAKTVESFLMSCWIWWRMWKLNFCPLFMLHPPVQAVNLQRCRITCVEVLLLSNWGIFRPQMTKLNFQFCMPSILHNAQCKIIHCQPNKILEICKMKEGG